MVDVLLDTNIFVKLDEDQFTVDQIKNCYRIFSTNAQLSEICAIKDPQLRERRLLFYHNLSPIKLNLRSGIWVDKLNWDDDQPWIDNVGEIFEHVRGRSDKMNTIIDSLIVDVAGVENLILVTDEIKIQKRARNRHVEVMDYSGFTSRLINL